MKKISILLLLSIVSALITYSNWRVYQSYIQQSILLTAINTNDFTIIPDEIVENIEYEYPNLSVTAMPLASIKGRAILDKPGRVGEALELFRKGKALKTNLYMTESMMSDIFFANNQLDSAFYYSKIAYKGLPLNTRHFIFYFKTLAAEKQKDEMRKTYLEIKNRISPSKKEELAKFYFAGMIQFRDSILIEEAKDFIFKNKEIKDKELKILISYCINGIEKSKKADSLNFKGTEFFNAKNYSQALDLFSEAIKINSLDFKFYENKLGALYEMEFYKEVYDFYITIPQEINISNGYIEFLTSKSLVKTNQINLACDFLKLSKNLGYPINLNNYNPCNK